MVTDGAAERNRLFARIAHRALLCQPARISRSFPGRRDLTTIGFIGLGVMGSAMCRNVAARHEGPVLAFDLSPQAREALSDTRARIAARIDEVWDAADVVFLSLPGAAQVEAVCLDAEGIALRPRKPGTVIDLSTTSVATARKVGGALAAAGVAFADAPVARTREAALKGELSIMVGAAPALFPAIEPLLRYMGTDITHGGAVGSGQFLKLVNNALLDVNVIAISEVMVLAERAGVDPAVMIEAVAKGSGDSYALRHHAVKSLLPRDFPEKSFPPEYKVKDLTYLLDLAEELDTPARSMELALDYYRDTVAAGYGGRYFTAVIELIARRGFDERGSA
jgi:3-hydroxyisobutyrate dehydrogenase-like beta-hydroxyacid dehydrogenase